MAKRYGRNQRRRHREQIAALEAAYERETALLRDISAKLTRLRQQIYTWDCDVREMLGGYSALLVDTGRMRTDQPFLRIGITGPAEWPYLGDGKVDPAEATMLVVDLKRLLVEAGVDRQQDLKQVIRMLVERSDGREELHYAYTINGRALMTLGQRDLPIIAKQVAEGLYRAAGGLHG
jgi:hypothetical protein